MEEKKVGRPTKATPETIALLLAAFAQGATVEVACKSADIAPSNFYEWIKKDVDFRTKVGEAREMIDRITVGNLTRAIIGGDMDATKWWAERRMKSEFSTRNELTGKDGKDLPTPLLAGIIDVRSDDSTKKAE